MSLSKSISANLMSVLTNYLEILQFILHKVFGPITNKIVNAPTDTICRAVVRTGAMGAIAPVNIQQRVLSTRPETEISREVT